MKELELTLRKIDMRGRPQPGAHVKERLAIAAENLTRSGDLAAHTEAANEAVHRYTAMLYEKDTDGLFANLELDTGRVRVAAPWGNTGWKYWGLRHWEAIILRAILMERAAEPSRPALFFYNRPTMRWHLNLTDYAHFAAATHVLTRGAIKLSEWRTHSARYRESEVERKRKAAVRREERNRK